MRQEDCSTLWDLQQKMLDDRLGKLEWLGYNLVKVA